MWFFLLYSFYFSHYQFIHFSFSHSIILFIINTHSLSLSFILSFTTSLWTVYHQPSILLSCIWNNSWNSQLKRFFPCSIHPHNLESCQQHYLIIWNSRKQFFDYHILHFSVESRIRTIVISIVISHSSFPYSSQFDDIQIIILSSVWMLMNSLLAVNVTFYYQQTLQSLPLQKWINHNQINRRVTMNSCITPIHSFSDNWIILINFLSSTFNTPYRSMIWPK